MSFEEDTYNTIFKAMQHPIRRRILRMLSDRPATYTELQTELNIDNGLLNYHLDALNSLITKNQGDKYTLSDFGSATTGLIRGVEDPSKAVPKVSTTPLMKWVIAILVIALTISGIGFVELNNRYLELSGQYRVQAMESLQLAASLQAAHEKVDKLNSTLTALEKNPLVKASTMIIDAVGVDYFNKYFHDPTLNSPYISGNDTSVKFKYRIDVGNYSIDQDVSFYFTKNYVLAYGVPLKDNLQPFNVTAEDAKRYALEAGLVEGQWGTSVYIVSYPEYDIYPRAPYADKYVWHVTSYLDPPYARARQTVTAIVDPVTGEVYRSDVRGGDSLIESMIDSAEKAAIHDIDGYVKVAYSELPDQIQIVRGGNCTFTFNVTYVSYNSNKPTVMLYVDPLYRDLYEIQSNMADKLRGVLSYEPSGTFMLESGSPISIKATIRFPDDEVGSVFLFHRYALNCLGIGAFETLVVSNQT